jgi:hypothetical protein
MTPRSITRRASGPAAIVAGLAIAAGLPATLGALTLGQAPKLPPGTLRGPISRLRQYPKLSLATPKQLAAAKRLRTETRAALRKWRDPRAAARAGYAPNRLRRLGNAAGLFLHAEHRAYSNDNAYLDPTKPEVLIYENLPGMPLVLIGVMFSVPRGVHGPTPGGPITRWHTHRVCAHGVKRGLAPRPDGSCPPGTKSRQGAEMLHFWLTRDLRSTYAIHGPVPELCAAGLMYREACDGHAPHGH